MIKNVMGMTVISHLQQFLNSICDESCIVRSTGREMSSFALLSAQRIQKEYGDNYKIIVFSNVLCKYLNTGIREFGLRNQVVTYWTWKKKQNCSSSDFVIVIGIEDFTAEEILEFTRASRKHFLFLGDTTQSIYEDLKGTVPVEDICQLFPVTKKTKELQLDDYILRIPIPVDHFSQYVGVGLPPLPQVLVTYNKDLRPYILKYVNVKEQVRAIWNIVGKENQTNVAILVPGNEMVRTVGEYLNTFGCKFEQKYSDKEDYRRSKDTLDFNSTNIKVMTYYSAKGLSFETVFLPMIENFDDASTSHRKALYVAMTCTYRDLYVMYSDRLPNLISNIPNNLYRTSFEK